MLDSTGLDVFGQGEWDGEKHGRTPRPWCKLHLAVDAETGEIMAHVLTDKDVGDIAAVPGLLATVEGPVGSVIADGAHDGASVYQAASLRQHGSAVGCRHPVPRLFVVSTNDTGTSTIRDRHVQFIAEKGRTAWQKATGYGRRSLVETTTGRYKHIVGPKLRARSSDGQRGEVAVAIQVLNRMIRIAKPIPVRSS